MTAPSPDFVGVRAAYSSLPRTHIFLLVVAIATLCLTIGYSRYLVIHLARVTETVVQPVSRLATEAAVTHLWTEEAITGDPEFTPEKIDRRYAEFATRIDILLEDLHADWMHSCLKKRSDLPELLARVKPLIAASREIAARRLATPLQSEPGSPADVDQDAAFAALMSDIAVFVGAMDEAIDAHFRTVNGIQLVMVATTFLLGIWIVFLLFRYEKRRLGDLKTIAEHNDHLRAANQQLMATEQQLRASNQQLMATEQQLRAANQQLTATEQELRQSNERLIAGEQELQVKNSDLLVSQQILEESEHRYRTLINHMAEGLAIHRLEFGPGGVPVNYRITEVNAQYESILGLRREDVVGRLATEVYGGDRAPYLEEYAAVAGGGPAIRFDTYFPPLDRYFSISVSSFEPGVFVTVFSDVTDRRRAEEAARLNEARLVSLLEITQHPVSSPDQLFDYALGKVLVLTHSRHGVLFLVDTATGLLVRKAVVCREGEACDKEGCGIERSGLPDVVLTERNPVLREPLTRDFPLVGEDRQALWRIMGVPLLVQGGVVAVVVVADKDAAYDNADIRQTTLLMDAVLRMAELRRAEDERNRLSIRMQKLESLGVLAGGIAHDFNNMLTAILANINLAALADDVAEALARLAEAERATLRATGLTQQLLAFSRGGSPVRKVMALPELITETATFAVRGSPTRCVFTFARDLWTAEIDGGQIGQVVNNLVLNAVQAMPAGGTIEISAENVQIGTDSEVPLTDGDYVRLTVSDQGVGISPENLEKIFDPYFTTKQQGSGLGLAASHTIVGNHRGTILVQSRLGEGTTFIVYLPACQASPPRERARTPMPAKGGGRVLVMDDESSLCNLLAQILRNAGYEPSLTTEGRQAVEVYRQAWAEGRGFDAVILDLTVAGGMGGREALALMREIDPGVRAIVSSGYSNDPVMADYRRYGFAGVICKPYTVREMQNELHRVLSEWQGWE